jgi:hypothetical protein
MNDPILIDGHTVDPATADLFYDGDTGERVSDEEWDETQRRIELAEALSADT